MILNVIRCDLWPAFHSCINNETSLKSFLMLLEKSDWHVHVVHCVIYKAAISTFTVSSISNIRILCDWDLTIFLFFCTPRRHVKLWEIALAISWSALYVLTIWADKRLCISYRLFLQDWLYLHKEGCAVLPFRWNLLSISTRLLVCTYAVSQLSVLICDVSRWSQVQRETERELNKR